ncbi:hypothetical protein OEA41_003995 [Lepraria neglecta]|uniref:Uncharacterized protein n=1 Tax=Lepraria neglecta TaxID=209136 RepID=A0AAE0DJH6_9LECA|nr:hypothetical protein OEA41_003995 [Lepraria neglecta]
MPRNTQNSRSSACDSHPAEASAPQRRARSRRGVSFSDEQTAAAVAGRAEQEKRKAEEKQTTQQPYSSYGGYTTQQYVLPPQAPSPTPAPRALSNPPGPPVQAAQRSSPIGPRNEEDDIIEGFWKAIDKDLPDGLVRGLKDNLKEFKQQ